MDGTGDAAPHEMDVAVIGGGVVGISTALFLARAGRSVAVFDRTEPWSDASGSNAGTLSIQAMRVEVLAMARLGIALWRRFQEEDGMDVGFARLGGFLVATDEAQIAYLRDYAAEQARSGLELEWLEANRMRDRAPWLGHDVRAATFCEEDSHASPLLAGNAMIAAARRAGGRILSQTPIEAVTREGNGYAVKSAAGTLRCGAVVVTAGPWSGEVARMLGTALPLYVDTNMLTITEPGPKLFDRVVSHVAGILTLKQYENGTCMIGGGWQGRGVFATGQRKTDYGRLRQNWATAASVVPGLANLRAVRSWAGFQAVTPDALPVIGRLPGHDQAYIAAGARGGFHMGPAQGLALAEMIQGHAPPLDLARFDPGRFA
ncbi:MAG: NAD(P)/FAD-dependent oxidoreductase [Alphaproteobacteria bacterium]